jgi:hypothetical protein
MERKAHENLVAARVLLEGDPCTNASISRAYYSAYQACWAALVERGKPVPETPRGRYFPHKELPALARASGVLSDDEQDDLEYLEGSRVLADYGEDDLGAAAARECLGLANRLVYKLLGSG